MNQITLNVKDENLTTVMSILENLKDGLIDTIDTSAVNKKRVRYQPNNNTIISESQKPTGKYASKAQYKSRLQ